MKIIAEANYKIMKECDRSGFRQAFNNVMPELIQRFDFASNQYFLDQEVKLMKPLGYTKEIILDHIQTLEKNKSKILKHAGDADDMWMRPVIGSDIGCCFWVIEKDPMSSGHREVLVCQCGMGGEGVAARQAGLSA